MVKVLNRELILLGFLKNMDLHGYQLNEMLDSHLGTSVHITKPTAYRILARLEEKGYISSTEEREGNRPIRKVFTITEQGDSYFLQLLAKELQSYQVNMNMDLVPLAFLNEIPKETAVNLLQEKRKKIEEKVQKLRQSPTHNNAFDIITRYQILHTQTDLNWLSDLIEKIMNNELTYLYQKGGNMNEHISNRN